MWATDYLAPILGTVLANVMWSAPLRDVYYARIVNKELGSLNPIPFTMMLINCTGWCVYGVMKLNYYIFTANCFGIIIGLFCSSSAMMMLLNSHSSHPAENEKDLIIRLEVLMIGGVSFWLLIILIVGIILEGRDPSEFMVGILCCIFTISYYAAPLSTLYSVIQTADASSLHIPTIGANFLCALMWFIYGIAALGDVFVWLPNGLGTILAIIQTFVVTYYNPRVWSDMLKSQYQKANGMYGTHNEEQDKELGHQKDHVTTVIRDSVETNMLTKTGFLSDGTTEVMPSSSKKHMYRAALAHSIDSSEEQKSQQRDQTGGSYSATNSESHIPSSSSLHSTQQPPKHGGGVSHTTIRSVMSGWRKSSVMK